MVFSSHNHYYALTGIVTRVDKDFIYVWNRSFGIKEIRFPIASRPDIDPGTSVKYQLNQDIRGVQYQKDLFVNKDHKYILRKFDPDYVSKRNMEFSVKTTLVFPPQSYEPYRKLVVEVCKNYPGCKGVAFSPDFDKVGCFASKFKFEPEVVYDAYVCRVPVSTPRDIIVAMDTLFILSIKDGVQENVSKQDEVLAQAPWNQQTDLSSNIRFSGQLRQSSYEEDENEEYEREEESTLFDASERRSSSRAAYMSNYSGEKIRPYPTARSTEIVEERSSKRHSTGDYNMFSKQQDNLPIYQGIVVRVENLYTVIWGQQHGNVVAMQHRNNEFPPLATWVDYCVLDGKRIGEIPVEEMEKECTKSAFRVKEIEPLRLSCALESTIQVQAKVRIDGEMCFRDNAFILAEDELLGFILCPKDSYLLRNLKARNEVEIFAVFIEDFLKYSKWFAVAVNRGGEDWIKLSNLPDRVEELAVIAFDERRNKGSDYKNKAYNWRGVQEEQNIIRTVNQGRRYGPPPGYKGHVQINLRKITDVLGLVVDKEENGQVSVIFTLFGLARVQTDYALGTWLKTNIMEDDEDDSQTVFSDVYFKTYQVYKCDKISPPMSTRVITIKERILLCGIVHWEGENLVNDYLGVIEDRRKFLNGVVDSPTGYLVEFGLVRRKTTKALFFSLLKYHGVAVKNHDWVPLEMSYYPNDLGRTMDDPHTLLLDPHYSSAGHLENVHMSSRQTSRQVSPSRESVSSNNFRTEYGLGYPRREEKQEKTACNYTCRTVPREDETVYRFEQHPNTGESTMVRTQRGHEIGVVEEMQHIQPVSRPMSTLPSTSALPIGRLPEVFSTSKEETGFNSQQRCLDSQLHLYRPEEPENKKRRIGLIVRKYTNCALLFSLGTGLVLIKSSSFEDDQQFDFECSLGNWVFSVFTKVQNASQLPYKFMGVGKISKTKGPENLALRVVKGFVQVLLDLIFNDETVSTCISDTTRLKVQSEVGEISVEKSLYVQKELHNSRRKFWVVFTDLQYECLWKLRWPVDVEQEQPAPVHFSQEDLEVSTTLSSPSKIYQSEQGTCHYSFDHEGETGRSSSFFELDTSPIDETHQTEKCPSPYLLSFEPVEAPEYSAYVPFRKEVPKVEKPVKPAVFVSLADLAMDELVEMGKKQKKVAEKEEEEKMKTDSGNMRIQDVDSASKGSTAIILPWVEKWHVEQLEGCKPMMTKKHENGDDVSGFKGEANCQAQRSTTTQSSTSDSFMQVDINGGTSPKIDDSWPSDFSDGFSPNGGVYKHTLQHTTLHTTNTEASLLAEEGLQDFLEKHATQINEPIIQYPSSSSCSSPEPGDEEDPAFQNVLRAHSPSTEGHESDREEDELMANEDNAILINLDEDVEECASQQLFEEDIFSRRAPFTTLLEDSTNFFGTLMARQKPGSVNSQSFGREHDKLKGGNNEE